LLTRAALNSRLEIVGCSLYPPDFQESPMTAEIEYEVVQTAPVEEIVNLYQAGGWWQESPEARSVIPPMISGSFCFMVARVPNDRIVGMGRVISDGFSDAYIQDVVVLTSFRHLGIGGELVRRLTRYCVDRNISWIGLVAEPGTGPFYERLGYRHRSGYELMLFEKRG
jgi:aralkylamine N-acetyltransferase